MKKNQPAIIVAALLMLFSQTSCFQKFYSTNSITSVTAADVDTAVAQHRHFILHYLDTVLALDAVVVKDGILHADGILLPGSWRTELNPKAQDKNLMPGREKDEVLSQAHLYINERYAGSGGRAAIEAPLTAIWRMDRYGLDRKATDNSTTLGLIGIIVPVAIVVGLAVAVSNMSFGITW